MNGHWLVVFESARGTDGESETFISPPESSRERAIEDARRLHLSPYGGTLLRVDGPNGESLGLSELQMLWAGKR